MVKEDRDAIKEMVRGLLKGRVEEYKQLDHLLYLWNTIPPEATMPGYPGVPTRVRFLAVYINWTEYEPWVWEVLRGFVQHLLDQRERVPCVLNHWVILVFARGGHVPKRGRPRKTFRDNRVVMGFTILQASGSSREAAIDFIADELSSETKQVATETVETIIKNHEYFTKHGEERSDKK